MSQSASKVDVVKEAGALLEKMGVTPALYQGGDMASFSPVSGEEIARLKTVSASDVSALSLIHI